MKPNSHHLRQPNRIVVLIDGDGAIFDLDLINSGLAGGHKAASLLSEYVMQYLPGRSQHQLWVYVFLNKRGMADTLNRSSRNIPKYKLDDFIIGFNQAAERFIMADVGHGKEVADAKIKGVSSAFVGLQWTLTREISSPPRHRSSTPSNRESYIRRYTAISAVSTAY